jgi:predicted nucleic acid-binding protein
VDRLRARFAAGGCRGTLAPLRTITFIDTGILVGALLEKHPEHRQCRAALELYTDCVTDVHALAETFATLTGFYKVPVDAAAELTLALRQI